MDRLDDASRFYPGGHRIARRRFSVGFARRPEERRAAQRLRWNVFAEEFGACLRSREPGVDADIFDAHCEHLVVRDEASGETIGTYRLLAPQRAARLGCYYAEGEFDLTRLAPIREHMVEVGRSCIHPDYRNGTVIALLWSGLARYMLAHRYRYLAGCASIGMADGGRTATAAWAQLRETHLAPIEYQVFPRCRLPLENLEAAGRATLPALLKGYLRCGAWICGEPAWDPDFNTADLFVLLPLGRVESRYARHFFGGSLAPSRGIHGS
jgi:putative hemolysin